MDILLGCGNAKERRISCSRHEWIDLVTVDIDPGTNPDEEWDLNNIPLPFSDSIADEIHAYQVLEHCGTQGDWKFFFDQFADFWRILKPGGYFCGIVPKLESVWLWGDPGHTRVIFEGTLVFLSQKEYVYQVGKTNMTDYRHYYKADLEIIKAWKDAENFNFILKAIK